MTNLKAWVLRLFPIAALTALFWPWHHSPAAIPVAPSAPVVVEETVTKTQDRLPQEVWPKIEGHAPIVLPTDIRPMDLSPSAEAGTHSPSAPAPHKVKHRPQRHVLNQSEPDNSALAEFFRAAARLAGAIQ